MDTIAVIPVLCEPWDEGLCAYQEASQHISSLPEVKTPRVACCIQGCGVKSGQYQKKKLGKKCSGAIILTRLIIKVSVVNNCTVINNIQVRVVVELNVTIGIKNEDMKKGGGRERERERERERRES